MLVATPALAQNVGGGTQLEEIVVTAQKREQNLQDVPISITALGAGALEANRIVDVRDLNATAPNLTVRVSAGGAQLPNYSMRGVVTAGGALGSDRGISLYIDGVYIQTAIGSVFELADIERIEVLKGPQGTLFGRNSTGGAISIVTRNPSGRFGVRQEVTLGNYDQFRTKTRVDLPQVGPVRSAFTFLHSERKGDTENLGAGTVWDYGVAGQGLRTSPKRLGDEDINAVFGAFSFDLLPNLDLSYKFDWTENHYTPDAQGMAYLDAPAIPGLGLSLINDVILGSQPNPGLLTPITNKRPDAVNNWYTTPSQSFAWGHNLTARYQITDEIAVKNIFSYRHSGISTGFQLDGLGGLVVTPPMVALGLAPAAAVGQPWIMVVNATQTDDRQWSDELQLTWTNRWFDLTAGYIHFDNKASGGGAGGIGATSFAPYSGFVLPNPVVGKADIHVKSDAVFAQIEGHVTSRLDVVGGYRLTRDEKEGLDTSVPGSIQPISYKNARPTWLAGVNYRPIDGVLTYAKYATGFISGGELATLTYGPETAKSYEIGVKADLLDRRLRTNLALFDVKYGDLQLTTSGLNVTPPVDAALVLVNAGSAKAKGFEWETTVIPLDGLTLSANLGYTDFKYTSLNPSVGTLEFFLPVYRPKWTNTFSAEYDTPPVYAGGHVMLRLDANYRSKTFLGVTYPQLNNQAAVDAVTTEDSWIVNGRAALVDFDLAGAKAQAALWARNILDNRDLTISSPFFLSATLGAVYPSAYERARTFGVDLIVEF